jgi:nucleotide-binding universal stress UspA family protein
MPFRKILVPIDFSEPSLRALRVAVALARHSGAELGLVHIGILPHIYSAEIGMSGAVGPLFTQAGEQLAREQRHSLEKLAHEEIPEAIRHSVEVREGYPPQEIIALVGDGGFDHVVMGTHGRTGLKRFLLGSVAERVVREAGVAVTVVP